MPTKAQIAETKRKKTPISAAFKPKAGQRTIRFAKKEDAAVAGSWAVLRYPKVFEKLAQ